MIQKFYKKQIGLNIACNAHFIVSDATVKKVRYIKPDGTTGEFDGVIEGDSIISYRTTSETDLDQSDVWTFWPYAEFENGDKIEGNVQKVRIYESGT
jgi:hypothetical protein